MTNLPSIIYGFFLPLIALAFLIATTTATTNQDVTEWLQDKRQDANVQELPSGILYLRKSEGEGEFHPSFDSYCRIELEISRVRVEDGTLTPEEIVESTVTGADEPKLIRPIDSLPAIREALGYMVEGDWWELYNRVNGGLQKITLELVSIYQGDLVPRGEHHLCWVELAWVEGKYQYQPVGSHCNDQEVAYIHKVAGWDARSAKAEQELTRLRRVLSKGNVKQDLAEWVRRRMHLLKQFLLEEMRLCAIYHVLTPEGQSEFFQEDCNAREQEYIVKVQYWELEKIQEELKRIDSLDQNSVDPTLASWIRRRIRILNQIASFKPVSASQPIEESPPENIIHNDEL
jgi:chorismate mutase